MKKNNKGMTLVEIVVVLLIASIAMTITGGILVNSLGYFNQSTQNSLDKQTLDGVLEYISGEIKYATDVKISSSKPDDGKDWHCFYVNNYSDMDSQQVLYRDDKQVFSKDFYLRRNLKIDVRGFYIGKHRLDMKLVFNNKKNEEVYSTSNTFELVNLNMDADKEDNEDIFSNISSFTAINLDNKLWYIKDEDTNNSGSDDNKDDSEITVAKQIECINTANNRGTFINGNYYRVGDFVFYDNSWWQLLFDANYYTSVGGSKWKKIDKRYSPKSAYTVGDIILADDGNYYKCLKDILNKGENHGYGPLGENGRNEGYWEYIGPHNTVTKDTHDCKSLYTNREKTVMNKLDNLSKNQLDSIEKFDTTKNYFVGDWVYTDEHDGIKQYYYKLLSGDGSSPGTGASSGWQKISRDWDVNSAYNQGDTVYVFTGYKALVTFNKTIDFKLDLKSKTPIENYEYDLWNTNNNLYFSVKWIN